MYSVSMKKIYLIVEKKIYIKNLCLSSFKLNLYVFKIKNINRHIAFVPLSYLFYFKLRNTIQMARHVYFMINYYFKNNFSNFLIFIYH
jgi:hypothetical protein